MQYYKFYIRKDKEDAVTYETIDEWGLYCSEFPFDKSWEAKELASYDWKDEDGKEVYYPDAMPLADASITVSFSYKGDIFSANTAIDSFCDYLTGRSDTGTCLNIFCDYTMTGWGCVHFQGIENNAELVRNGEDGDIYVFKVKFSLDNPADERTYIDGNWENRR